MVQARYRTIAPYGAWTSPIDAVTLTQKASVLGELATVRTQPSILYTLTRASDGGRATLLSMLQGKTIAYHVPGTVRSSVHEYGGGALAMFPNGDAVVAHQSMGTHSVSRVTQASCEPLVEPSSERRFADFGVHPDGSKVLAVAEDHTQPTVVNALACIHTDGSPPTILDSMHDFYAYPRFSPDGKWVAYVTWDHPHMPFWSAQLWVAAVQDTRCFALDPPILVAGHGQDQVAQQPVWAPTDEPTLFYTLSGTTGGGVYEAQFGSHGIIRTAPAVECRPPEVEVQPPLWSLNSSSLVALDPQHLVYVETSEAEDMLVLLDRTARTSTRLYTDYTQYAQLRIAPDGCSLLAIASAPTRAPALIRILLSEALRTKPSAIVVSTEVLQASDPIDTLSDDFISVPERITFPTRHPNGSKLQAHALFYPPTNPDFQAPAGTLPPCRVVAHGGPTGRASATLDMAVQYWTTRGWAVCAVNFGGSTGYGYAYMRRLNGHWGDMDIRDCVAAASYLSGLSPPDEAQNPRPAPTASPFRLTESRDEQGAHIMTLSRKTSPVSSEFGLALCLGIATSLAAHALGLSTTTALSVGCGLMLGCMLLRAFCTVFSGTSLFLSRIHSCHSSCGCSARNASWFALDMGCALATHRTPLSSS